MEGLSAFAPPLLLLGHICLGALFVVAGVRHLTIIPVVTQAMTDRGLPAARALLLGGTAFQIVAGLLLMLGLFVPVASLGLVVFTVAASVLMLNFWDLEGPARAAAVKAWQSNIAVVGGLLVAAAQAIAA